LKRREHLEDVVMDGRIILELILDKQDGRLWSAFIWRRIRTGGDSCEHSSEPSGSIKGGEFLD
jgi:hypothetical protein